MLFHKRDETSDVSMVRTRLNAKDAPRPGGCNGGAQRSPLPRLRYYTAHLAICGSRLFCHKLNLPDQTCY